MTMNLAVGNLIGLVSHCGFVLETNKKIKSYLKPNKVGRY